MHFERTAWRQGRTIVAGLDEVGRGPLAGPVVAACVALPRKPFSQQLPDYFQELDDSKKLTPTRREDLAKRLQEERALQIGVGIVDPLTIDRINILEATRLAMVRALQRLTTKPDALLLDALALPAVDIPQTILIKGDQRSLSIAAASIVAKVFRDRMMEVYDLEYPRYGFARHKGYGTPEHLESLRRHGPCILHRRSFEPVRLAAEVTAT